jgi:hypothetical protein
MAFTRKLAIRAASILLLTAFVWLLYLNLPTRVTRVLAFQDWGKFSKKSEAALEVQRKLIDQELKSLHEHPWAGHYYYGDGLGVNVRLDLAPRSGFVFTWHGCLGLYDLNYGKVEETGGQVKLVFKFPNDQKGFQGIASELIPVLWGARHYLIPADGIVDFANAINAGFEPRSGLQGRFLLRDGDELKPVSGKPNVPSEYSAYLLDHPIEAEISSVKESRVEDLWRIVNIQLNVGTAQGVKTGMEFWVSTPDCLYGNARITDVGSAQSHATLKIFEADYKSNVPSPGWRLSTHAGPE